MPAERQALDTIRTTADAGRTLRSFGPDWDAAVADGVDVALLLENLALPPKERLRLLDEQNRLLDDVQRRTVSEPVRRAMEARRLREKSQALDPDGADRHG